MEHVDGRRRWGSILLVWAVALAGAVSVVAFELGGAHVQFGTHSLGGYDALVAVLAICVLVGLIVELATRRPAGFVFRLTTSLAGVVAVLLLAAIVLLPAFLAG
ncbi:hypothetical protein [Agromyces seonyuensis]|uniref:Uncharacterized protein n=1 Tax=Agromyces seonyuensis TaxID=2662446 RepID=A0A6I4NTI7_9MICO|nr:hypothetical protein [Agromyces seonyuensis]MWB97708.1 hypothetical protein [Agromyces seonyuensis]